MPISRAAKPTKIALSFLLTPLALLISAGIVVNSSNALFNGAVSNDGSEWRAGNISIGNSSDDSIGGHVLFDDQHITPGYSSSRCVTVKSRSTVDTKTKMYGVNVSDNDFSEAMRIRIDKGHIDAADAAGTSCDSFRNSEPIFDGSLAGFGREAADYSTGVSRADNGDHLSPGGNLTYRITIGLPDSTDNSLADSGAGATFKWEAQG